MGNKQEQQYKVDLHVHSPASSDFQGNRTRKGYYDLIKAYKEADVSALAITDHNTIRGYAELVKIREQTKQNYELNSSRDDAADFLKQLKDEMLRFAGISIIPGVEVSVFPGIHLILLFDESLELEKVEKFLKDDLGLGDAVENGDPDKVSQFPPVIVLQKAEAALGDKFFCILPHIESSKGAWQELEGASRAELFRHPKVLAVQILNPDMKRRLETTMQNADYRRESALRVIQASDYHGSQTAQPAHQHCSLESDRRIDFAALRARLNDKRPIKISSDSVDDLLKTVVKGKQVVSFDFQDKLEPTEERLIELAEGLCACFNTPKTVLQFNLFNIKETSNANSEKLNDLMAKVLERLDPSDGCSFRISDFSHSEARQRIIFEVTQNRRLRLFNHKVLVRDGEQNRPAQAWEIERMVSKAFYERYGKTKQKALVNASQKLLMISNSLPAFSIAARVDQSFSAKVLNECELSLEKPKYDSDLEPPSAICNGLADGDYYLLGSDLDLKGGRLIHDCYYRFSTPAFKYARPPQKEIETLTVPAGSLIVFPDGGVNYCEQKRPLFAPFPVLSIKPNASLENGSEVLLGLCAYLKSSFVLWYISTIHESDDFFGVMVSGSKRLPIPNDPDFLRRLSHLAHNILVAEHSILNLVQKHVGDSEEQREKRQKDLEKHNSSCSKSMRLIEREVFRFLKASDDEIKEVYRVLRQLKLHDYCIGDNIEEFIKEVRE